MLKCLGGSMFKISSFLETSTSYVHNTAVSQNSTDFLPLHTHVWICKDLNVYASLKQCKHLEMMSIKVKLRSSTFKNAQKNICD